MNVIKRGDRGPAVEDIQRRLLSLGYQLGQSGVDGVFQRDTQEAIERFQEVSELPVTGLVDDRTWSALVDSSFSFGDRLLYLRAPFFHGNDVAQLQEVLNTLGFYCGPADAIFGAWTERAVSEFQSDSGLEGDGVVGTATFDALQALRHIWGGKSVPAHSASAGRPRDRNALMEEAALELVATDADSYRIARRVANLAQAAQPNARVAVISALKDDAAPMSLWSADASPGPVLRVTLTRTEEGIVLSGDRNLSVPIVPDPGLRSSQQGFQHLAAVILDVIFRS